MYRVQRYMVLCLLAALLSGCAASNGASSPSSKHDGTPILGLTHKDPPPPGWRRIVDGERFTDEIASSGLVASAARNGRLAGCTLPAGMSSPSGVPVFALSDDNGATWRTKAITGAATARSCQVVADTKRPDTFALSTDSALLVTTDAGQTWRTLSVPTGYEIASMVSRFGAQTVLVGGSMVMVLRNQQASTPQLAEVTTDGMWHFISMPNGNSQRQEGTFPSIEAYALDPDSPSDIYVTVSLGAVGVTLFGSTDAGSSWHVLRVWPTAYHVRLWTATDGQVFAEDLSDRVPPYSSLAISTTRGQTWHDATLQEQHDQEVFVSPSGLVVTDVERDASAGDFYRLNAQTGKWVSLGTWITEPAGTLGIITSGPTPTLILANQMDTLARSLPTA